MRRWGSTMCSGFCASSSIHTEKDRNQHVEYCRCCRRCYSTQLPVWPLGSDWSGGWPRDGRSQILSGESCAAKEGSQGHTGAMVWLHHQLCHEAAPRTTVRISDVVEVRVVQYVEEHNKLGLPCCSWSLSSSGKSKKRRVPVSAVAAKKTIFRLKSVC